MQLQRTAANLSSSQYVRPSQRFVFVGGLTVGGTGYVWGVRSLPGAQFLVRGLSRERKRKHRRLDRYSRRLVKVSSGSFLGECLTLIL